MTRKHLKGFLLLLLIATAGRIEAQIPNNYYTSADGKTGDELKTALHGIITGHTTISYNQIWNAFWSTDNKGNGIVWDMYSDIPNGTPAYTFELGQAQCGSYNEEGDCYNREHSWPESWFKNESTPRTDLHHIFPVDGFVNNQRSSYPFGEVSTANWTSTNGSKLGNCKASLGYTGTVFEPIDEYKGDFARAFFYMSVRYFSEDDNWGNSGMTNKSEIKDWAMTMLFNWNEQDPVSEKEINRNNVIYNDYQHNRNPFIDHPEYARMIWDPNWEGVVTYTVTCSEGLQHGSVSASHTSAPEGLTVQLTATPDPGYMLDSWDVYKTGSPSTKITVSNNSFVMPAYGVTVSASFMVDNTTYSITLGEVSHGSIAASASSALSGTTVTLTATPDAGYSLYSWYVYKTGDMSTTVNVSGNSFTMPSFNVTVSAAFTETAGYQYEKVTSALSDWSGEYLIVYEGGNVAFDGGLTTLDATENTIAVTISDQTIAYTTTTQAAQFTIAPMTGGYSIQAASGKYIGNGSNSNGLTASDSPLLNTIAFNNGDIDIIGSGGAYLRYNSNSGQNRFRYFKSSTYTAQKAIQLYKKTGTGEAPTRNINFHPNGGSGTMNTQTVTEFEPTALNLNTFTREGYVYNDWNTEADGTGTYYIDGATVILLSDLDLYAQWDQLHTVTLVQTQGGTISADPLSAVAESTISLTVTTDSGYEFDGWTVTDENGQPVNVDENQFEMPASDVTVAARFTYVGQTFAQEYHRITSTEQLVAGRTYLVVNTTNGQALSKTQNNNNRSATAVTISNNTISEISANVCELTLGGATDAWTFFDAAWGDNGGYLYAASSSSNYLKTQATNDANGQWAISFNGGGMATIVAQGANARNHLRYNANSGTPIFSCYANSSTLPLVELYIRSEEYNHTESETIANLFDFDKHTVGSGATLTVTGTATCTDATHLIIEDGGQLITNNSVKGTMKKNVTGYGNSPTDGYCLMASPIDNLSVGSVTNLLSNDYDLYRLDWANNLWINQKDEANGFNTLSLGTGYLYANSADVTLRFAGDLNVAFNELTTTEEWNLIGNPFTCNATVNTPYYRLNAEGNALNTSTEASPLNPLEGIFVNSADTFTFCRVMPETSTGNSNATLNLSISQNRGSVIDNAIIRFDNGGTLPKFTFRDNTSKLFIPQNAKEMAVVRSEGQGEMPVSFQAAADSRYSLSVNAENVKMDYLHLIDNLTGMDVDLLATPNYSFEAKTTDYASRFRLVFNVEDDSSIGSGAFAFVSNGNIIITGIADTSDVSLQVVDLMGRMVVSYGGHIQCVPTAGIPTGLYILRLINGNEVKTQKIVVK